MSDIFGGKPSQSTSYQQSNSGSNSLGASLSNSNSNAASNSVSNNQSTSGSTSNSSSGNQAFNTLLGGLSPQITNGTAASTGLAGLLGIGGDPAAQQHAFDTWKNSTGYQFGLDQGSQAITQNNAAKGLLNSGATAKALDTYGQNYANTQFQNYLNPLQSLISSGNSAAGVLSGAGGVSNSNSNSNAQSTGTSLANSYNTSNANSVSGNQASAFGNSYGTSNATGATQGLGGLIGGILGGIGAGK